MNSPSNSLQELSRWYRSQCNGEWEHDYGIRIETLDNPGWWIKIDVPNWKDDTSIKKVGDEGSYPWIEIYLKDGVLNGACGPDELSELLDSLLDYLRTRNPSE